MIGVNYFTSEGSWFHIFGPKAIKLLSPYFADLWCLTKISKGLILGFLLEVNMSFMTLGLVLLVVLKIYVAKKCVILISVMVVLLFFNKVA